MHQRSGPATKPPAKKRLRPIVQPNAPKGIDNRTWNRYATPKERELAGRALQDLETNRNRVGLAPAPDPHFDGHMIHVLVSDNPAWYKRFVEGRWNRRGCQVKRGRVVRALERVYGNGIVRGNGYDGPVLKALIAAWG